MGGVGGAKGTGGTRHRRRVMYWPPSILLTFPPPHSLSQDPAKDLHPKQGYPARLEDACLSSAPGHRTVIAACKHSCSPAASGKCYFLLRTNRK